jgi:cyanophycinase-like exopeptidase
MCGRAGGGDFLVIRTTGTDAYNPYIQQLCPQMDSVETIIITSVTGANSAYVSTQIQNAEALWIAGGDQSTYVNLWRGTAVQTGVNFLLNSKLAPVGGTSAGLAVLSQFIYTGQLGSVTSSQALGNPFHRYVTLDRDLFQSSLGVNKLYDSHFVTRDRMGRSLVREVSASTRRRRCWCCPVAQLRWWVRAQHIFFRRLDRLKCSPTERR